MNQKTQIVELLKETRHLLKRGWCQGAWAKDIQGHPIESSSLKAECFCLMGAIYRAGLDLHTPIAVRNRAEDFVRNALLAEGEVGGIIVFNDAEDRCLSEVLKLIDKAITSVETSHDA